MNEMEVSVNVGGLLIEPIEVKNVVKQGDLVSPTIFSIFFSVVLFHAFGDCPYGIYIRYRTSGKLFNIRRFAARIKTLQALIRDLLYADDCDLISHTEQELQAHMSSISRSCKAFGLTSTWRTRLLAVPFWLVERERSQRGETGAPPPPTPPLVRSKGTASSLLAHPRGGGGVFQ